jgi:hypothetical protein
MGLGRLISNSFIHTDLHNINNKLVSDSWSTFDARTNHEQTQIHKTHHGSDFGEATTLDSPKPKFPKLRFAQLWGLITLSADLRLR